jgi:Acyl-CoA synthetase (NDP forming)
VLPKYVSGMNPVDFTFDQTPDQVRRTIEIAVKSEDVGSFIVIIQTEMLGAYIDTLRSIDYRGRPILAVVASKEFVIEDTIKMERAGIPVYSTPEQAAEVLGAMWMYRKERR